MKNKAFYYSHRFGKIHSFGRTMIEMLGVLAIIGVLSISALNGYQFAVRKYKANRIRNFLSQVALGVKETCYQSEKCLLTKTGYAPNRALLCGAGAEEACQVSSQNDVPFSFDKKLYWTIISEDTINPKARIYIYYLFPEMCKELVQGPLPPLNHVAVGSEDVNGHNTDENGKLSDATRDDLAALCDTSLEAWEGVNRIYFEWAPWTP